MSSSIRFRVDAQASSGLLCRIIGLFAQLDLPAPALRVTVAGGSMAVEASLAHFGDALVSTVACKMARFVGVRAVTLDAGLPGTRPESGEP